MPRNFCCCFNLRSGCIVFAWLQLMITVLLITGMWTPLILLNEELNKHITALPIHIGLSLFTGMHIIKGVTCVTLIWGIAKNNHMFYQPWLFIQGIENVIYSSGLLALFIGALIYSLLFFFLFPFGVLIGSNWYFWTCIYEIYKKDRSVPVLLIDKHYETLGKFAELNSIKIN